MGLEQYQGDMAMCCRCSACKFIPMQRVNGFQYAKGCPSIARYDYHSYSGGGRLNIGAAMLKNGFNYTDKLLDIVYNCQMCGACGVSCNYAMDMEVLEPISEFRLKCVQDGKTNPALNKVIAGVRKTGSMVPGAKGKRGAWAAGLKLKDAAEEKVDVLFHVGCLTSYNKDYWKLAKATVKILQKAGVKTLVTGCADGYQAFKVLYDRYNLKGNLEVLHISEYIAQLIAKGKLKLNKKVNLNVTYHDPCRLGRLGAPWIHWKGKKIPGDRFVFDPPKTYRRGTPRVYEPPRGGIKK